MIEGILWAVFAGITLGLYALPEKFTKEFEFENTWGLMFAINMFLVPLVAGLLLINGFWEVLAAMPMDIVLKMGIASVLWGIGVMMWGRAINYIGLSLGFSIFIGTVILVGSMLPFIVDGLPSSDILTTILVGIGIVLLGIFANGQAGMLRQRDEGNSPQGKGSMVTGIIIAVTGGLLATGFSYANAVGRPTIHAASVAAGNPEWVTAVGVMFVIYVAGGLFVVPYFIVNLTTKKLWGNFRTPFMANNLLMTGSMAILNFTASASFAYAAYLLGQAGNTVGYAIFNTISVAVAIVSGLLTKEWANASSKARLALFAGLGCMIIGVLIIAFGNNLAA
ncbi:L-rhamnose/proton symporter RhaT [Pontibacter sp. G13]|uniref:L-rhamnose/proton symporter RhaT n=1 Tax=Pontibacter sp. G13 TaxID=3074898 RepID=UPI002889EA90|nr:L-rhamnose/proton symporter RhaT [Pontibacter sp. G13]WNJ16561.1 L-rhamnose/proton symporter RhaT [Pontibacter sp. G13]